MCNLADGIEERGYQKGYQEGYQEGHQIGVSEMRIECAKKLLMGDYSVEAVAEIVELPVSEVEALKE